MFACITRYTKTLAGQDPGGSDRTPWTTALFVRCPGGDGERSTAAGVIRPVLAALPAAR